MTRSLTKYICARCGLSVYSWAKGEGITWKHAAGWHTGKSCGKPPLRALRPPSTDPRDVLDKRSV